MPILIPIIATLGLAVFSAWNRIDSAPSMEQIFNELRRGIVGIENVLGISSEEQRGTLVLIVECKAPPSHVPSYVREFPVKIRIIR